MSTTIRRVLTPDAATVSKLAGWFLAQLDDQSRRLTEAARGATPEELAWQSAPGANTIGMLLAHIAAVEVGWIQIGVLGFEQWEEHRVTGRPYEDFGMPLPVDGVPPAYLADRDLAFYDDLLARARAHTRAALAPLTDADLERSFRVKRSGGGEVEANVAWVAYHVLEHLAGHFGQILLLRHAYRDALARQA